MGRSYKAGIAFFMLLGLTLAIKISASAMMLTKPYDSTVILVNNTEVDFPDAKPFIDGQSRIQVPVRPVCEALGAELDWDDNSKTVTITKNETVVNLVINSKVITINGEEKETDTEAVIKDGRTYVPVRFVGEAFGADVEWLGEINIIKITFEQDEDAEAEFIVNHRILAYAFEIYMSEHDGGLPQNLNDLSIYINDIDGILNSPEGVEHTWGKNQFSSSYNNSCITSFFYPDD